MIKNWKRNWKLQLGLILAAIGFLVPIPGPADDPVDFIGYGLILLGAVQAIMRALGEMHKKYDKTT